MIFNQVGERYAQALFDLAKQEGKLEGYLGQLEFINDLIKSNEEFNNLLRNPKLTNGNKKELLLNVFEGKLSNNLINLINLLIDKGREDLLSSIYFGYKRLLDVELGRLEVEVTSAVELSSEDKDKLKDKLEELTSKDVVLSLKVKEELLGGLMLKVGNKVIDGSILNSLERLENKLKSLEVSKLGVKTNES
ncbi:ATP synthase F1 subunit delta [Halonatronum saccharophilum]|uniref:ATP synthase F1 subunit delta n=1 Tax=Halonatronum saccharophilum TaxID=150060 RepID=UPI00048720AE|nr:ATP synthase F1 subunit delta [Halonatronum saccharophilum]